MVVRVGLLSLKLRDVRKRGGKTSGFETEVMLIAFISHNVFFIPYWLTFFNTQENMRINQ